MEVSKLLEKFEKIKEMKFSVDKPRFDFEEFYLSVLGKSVEDGWEVKKYIEKIVITPGSKAMDIFGARLSGWQEKIFKIGEQISVMTRGIWKLFNDLRKAERLRILFKEWEKKKDEKALYQLKAYWMTEVDPKESGRGSINALAAMGMPIIRDAFFACKSIEEAEKLEINERVKRILLQKLKSFFIWLEYEKENVERRLKFTRSYLKSMMSSLENYISWLKPLLRFTRAFKFEEWKEPFMLSLFDQTLAYASLFLLKEVQDGYFCLVKLDLKCLGRHKRISVPPAGETYVLSGSLSISLEGYAINEKQKKELFDAIDEEEQKALENIVSKSEEEIIKSIKEYLEAVEKGETEYIKKSLGIEEEKKKKSLKEKIKEESLILSTFIEAAEFFSKLFKKKKEEKKEEKEKPPRELKIYDHIKDLCKDEFDKLVDTVKAIAGIEI